MTDRLTITDLRAMPPAKRTAAKTSPKKKTKKTEAVTKRSEVNKTKVIVPKNHGTPLTQAKVNIFDNSTWSALNQVVASKPEKERAKPKATADSDTDGVQFTGSVAAAGVALELINASANDPSSSSSSLATVAAFAESVESVANAVSSSSSSRPATADTVSNAAADARPAANVNTMSGSDIQPVTLGMSVTVTTVSALVGGTTTAAKTTPTPTPDSSANATPMQCEAGGNAPCAGDTLIDDINASSTPAEPSPMAVDAVGPTDGGDADVLPRESSKNPDNAAKAAFHVERAKNLQELEKLFTWPIKDISLMAESATHDRCEFAGYVDHLVNIMQNCTLSTSFSGIDTPATCFAMMFMGAKKLQGRDVNASDLAMLRSHNLFGFEWATSSQHELLRHPFGPCCLFSDMNEVYGDALSKKIPSLVETRRLVDVVLRIITNEEASLHVRSTCHCLRHNDQCSVSHPNLSTQGKAARPGFVCPIPSSHNHNNHVCFCKHQRATCEDSQTSAPHTSNLRFICYLLFFSGELLILDPVYVAQCGFSLLRCLKKLTFIAREPHVWIIAHAETSLVLKEVRKYVS